MRSASEIEGSIEKIERLLKEAEEEHHAVIIELNAKKAALKWVLER